MCMIEGVLHLRHCVGEFIPEAKLKWCHIASRAQADLCGNTVFNGLIALDVLLTVRNPLSHRSDAYLLRYMALGYAASLLSGVVATLPGVIEDGGTSSFGACWVHVDWMLMFYAPLWCTMLFCTVVLCYFVLKKYRARRKGQTQKLSMRQRLVKRMLIFTSVFIVQWIAVSVARGCMPRAATWKRAPASRCSSSRVCAPTASACVTPWSGTAPCHSMCTGRARSGSCPHCGGLGEGQRDVACLRAATIAVTMPRA